MHWHVPVISPQSTHAWMDLVDLVAIVRELVRLLGEMCTAQHESCFDGMSREMVASHEGHDSSSHEFMVTPSCTAVSVRCRHVW